MANRSLNRRALIACCWFSAGAVSLASQTQPVSWQAKWITAPGMTSQTAVMPLFRREFTLKKNLAHATLSVSALGQGEVHINGVKVSNDELAPAWTDYSKTVRYESYDVTAMLRHGNNVLGVMVGNGMFNVVHTPHRFTKFEGSFGVPQVLLQLELRYADGSRQTIASDGSWQTIPGPIVFSSTYGGEDYDARKEIPGWDSASEITAADWKPVTILSGPAGKLQPEVSPPIRVMHTYTTVSKSEPKPGAVVYDIGQNIAGWPAITVRGARGAVIKMIPGDLLNPDGTVSQRSSGSPQWFSYTLKGDGTELWHPRFSYYGFRWVQVEITGDASLIGLEGQAVHSSSKVTGSFESSDPMLNAIHKLIVEAMHNNEESLFSDCPHREKLGWLEQTHLVAQGLIFNNDLRGLYAATAQNMIDAQHADGDVPTTAPQYTVFGPKYAIFDDSPEWGSAIVLAPWDAFQFYGDKSQLAHAYPAMQCYVAFLESKATAGIVTYGLGDWFDLGPAAPGVSQLTSPGVTGTLMLYQDAATLAKIAALLGKPHDAAHYAALAAREEAAFQAHFFDTKAQFYDKGSQAAQAMPLALGVVPENSRTAVLAQLIADIHAHNDHVTTGEVGWAYLVRALIVNHRSDVLLAMLLRNDPPSYGSQLAAGATTLTESWDSKSGSQDHFMLGAGEQWFYQGLLGIDLDMSRAPGDQLHIEPQIPGGLNWVRGSYDSALGPVSSAWRHDGPKITLQITTPVAAVIRVPLRPGDSVSFGYGEPGVTRLRSEPGAILYRVRPGTHKFVLAPV